MQDSISQRFIRPAANDVQKSVCTPDVHGQRPRPDADAADTP
jgi:hypothetical protein